MDYKQIWEADGAAQRAAAARMTAAAPPAACKSFSIDVLYSDEWCVAPRAGNTNLND
jgi:hypothetical protein